MLVTGGLKGGVSWGKRSETAGWFKSTNPPLNPSHTRLQVKCFSQSKLLSKSTK